MPQQHQYTLGKKERLCSHKLIDKLFKGGGSRSMSAFPLRMVYAVEDRPEGGPQAQVLVSVPKRCFKRAVRRNRAKRLIREAYRHGKPALAARLDEALPGKMLVMAFVYTDTELHDYATVSRKVGNLLARLAEKL